MPYLGLPPTGSNAAGRGLIAIAILASAAVLPITGWLGNYMGRKRFLMLAGTLFTGSSVFCGLAPSLPLPVFLPVLTARLADAEAGALVREERGMPQLRL